MFFASLLAMIIASIIGIGLLIAGIVGLSKSLAEKENKKNDGNIIVLDVSKRIHEQAQVNSLAVFDNGNDYEAGLFDITRALDNAKTDANIKGVLLKLGPSGNGWATMQQLRIALENFKKSGKFIYGYGEDITQGAYFVGSVADSVYLNPAGDLDLKGFASILAFFKGTLDKLELQPEIFYAGKFKSATEPFRAEKMSEPNRQQIQAFQAGIWNEFTEAVAKYAHTDKAAINELAQKGTIQFPSDALKHNLVAGLLYWDEVEQRLRAKTGLSSTATIKYVSMNDYASGHKNDASVSENKIAVLVAEGAIVDGTSKDEQEIASRDFCDEIRKVAKNDKIKAVVLRVNSPGGSARASEVILRELELLKQKKHVIVSMGDYAASGGYYISCMADSIFALPNTLTGSIGVFSMMFSMDKLMKNKLGVTFDGVKNAPYADVPTSSRPLTPEEGQRMQNSVDTIYGLFKRHVAAGRHLSLADVDSIAQGRVWTGTDAREKGLVDGLGGLNRAIASAAAIANLKDYRVVTYPEPVDKLNMLLKKFKSRADANDAMRAMMKEQMGDDYQWLKMITDLRRMNGRAMMAMPYVITIN